MCEGFILRILDFGKMDAWFSISTTVDSEDEEEVASKAVEARLSRRREIEEEQENSACVFGSKSQKFKSSKRNRKKKINPKNSEKSGQMFFLRPKFQK